MINLSIWTLIIHLGFFLVMLVVLNKLLFQPMLAVMDERTERVDGNREAADKAVSGAGEMIDEYQSRIAGAKKELGSEKDEVRRATDAEVDKLLQSARISAGEVVADVREKVAAQYQAAEDGLKADSQAMGKDVAERILGRSVN